MNIELKSSMKKCLDEIYSRLQSGARHISVAITYASGISVTELALAEKLSVAGYGDVTLVLSSDSLAEQLKGLAMEFGGTKFIDLHTVQSLNSAALNKVIILHELDEFARKQVEICTEGKDVITISFFRVYQDVKTDLLHCDANNNVVAVIEPSCPDDNVSVACVSVTKTILDIRDVKYASQEEIDFVRENNDDVSNALIQGRKNALFEKGQVQQQIERIRLYMNTINEIYKKNLLKKQAEELARYKEMEKVYQERIEEQDTRIESYDCMISFYESLMARFGVDQTELHRSFDEIQRVKNSLSDQLNSKDEWVQETALKKIQDMVTDIIDHLTSGVMVLRDQRHFEAELKSKLSENVWNRLDQRSRNYLITAKYTYESMIRMTDHDSFDYSGVCLLVTKALEVETANRFFIMYKEYIESKYTSVSEWPQCLRKKDHGQITELALLDEDFTLGSVVFLLGYYREQDQNGQIVAYRSRREEKAEFLDYARLFLFNEGVSVEEEIVKDYEFVEKVRLDYRNPAAHRGHLTITSAESCLNYVIDVQHKLKQMLEPMRI